MCNISVPKRSEAIKAGVMAKVDLTSGTVADSEDSGIIGISYALEHAKELAFRAARTGGRVLIWGGTGTGKELFARLIHNRSARYGRPFESMNCAALPEGLVESLLFGHEKGAFTGANVTSPGKLERAHVGTLFLDEVGDLALPAQAKVLKALEDGEVEHVGGRRKIKVDVRIIAATHRNLWQEVCAGRFREDLFYRLSVVTIRLPFLRERREDIPLLVDFFVRSVLSKELNLIKVPYVSKAAMQELMMREWRGNVRELRNVLEMALTLYGDEPILEVKHFSDPRDFWNQSVSDGLSQSLPESEVARDPWRTFREIQVELILKALRDNGGNRTKAAESLGITTRTIRNHLARARKENGV